MLPLTLAKKGEPNTVKKVGGADEARLFLEKLGFVPGSLITVICENGGNVIVSVKDSRIAVSREMACKIMV